MASRTLEGAASYVSFSRSDATGWTIAVAMTRDVLYANLFAPLLMASFAMAGAVLGGVMLAVILSRHVREALDTLKSATEAATTGNLDAVAPLVGPPEIVRLARQFNKMQSANKDAHGELRALARRVESIRENERRRIARNVHDELGQVLTVLKLDIVWVKDRLLPEQATLAAKAGEMTRVIHDALDTVRKISQELHPAIIEALDLAGAIEWQVSEFRKYMGIRCNLTLPGSAISTSQEVKVEIFRICQELLTNVSRHAQANRVDVTLAVEGGFLTLSVRDNGIGMKPVQGNRKSLGLVSVRERLGQMAGTMEILSAPSFHGTQVTFRIPLAELKRSEHEDSCRR